MALPCNVFTFGLASISTYLHDYLHYVDYIDIYSSVLSSTAFTYSYVFLVESFELSECDRTLNSLCSLSQNSISPSHMHSIETVECLHCVLVSRRYKDNHKVRFQCSFLHIKSGEAGTTARQFRRAWDVEQTPNFR